MPKIRINNYNNCEWPMSMLIQKVKKVKKGLKLLTSVKSVTFYITVQYCITLRSNEEFSLNPVWLYSRTCRRSGVEKKKARYQGTCDFHI